MSEDKPLMLVTDLGLFATTALTPNSISNMCSKGGVLVLNAGDTCHIESVSMPEGEELGRVKIPFRYVSLALTEETERIYLLANRVIAYFYSERLPGRSVFDEVAKEGTVKMRAKKAGLSIVEKRIVLPEDEL